MENCAVSHEIIPPFAVFNPNTSADGRRCEDGAEEQSRSDLINLILRRSDRFLLRPNGLDVCGLSCAAIRACPSAPRLTSVTGTAKVQSNQRSFFATFWPSHPVLVRQPNPWTLIISGQLANGGRDSSHLECGYFSRASELTDACMPNPGMVSMTCFTCVGVIRRVHSKCLGVSL